MKNLLPKTKLNPQGFTLIELLVTISIIAILAVVGVSVYQGQARNARNSARKADIDAIATGMEAQKTQTSALYPAMYATFFSAGKMPNDPINTINGTGTTCSGAATNYVCKYCYTTSATPIANCSETASYIDVTTAPAGWTASATWTVCANLETTGSVCRSNAQ